MPLPYFKTQILSEAFAHVADRIEPPTLAELVAHFRLTAEEMRWSKENKPELYAMFKEHETPDEQDIADLFEAACWDSLVTHGGEEEAEESVQKVMDQNTLCKF